MRSSCVPPFTALSLYLERYRADRDRLASIVLSAHRYGAINPRAWVRGDFTAADYVASPMLLEPLKVADCFPTDESYGPVNDSGVCVLVTRSERAPADRPGVFIVQAGHPGRAGGDVLRATWTKRSAAYLPA